LRFARPRGWSLPQVSVPFRSFSGPAALRSSPVRLFGEVAPAGDILGFACNTSGGLSFQWSGDDSSSNVIPLAFQNQARRGGMTSDEQPDLRGSIRVSFFYDKEEQRGYCVLSARTHLSHGAAVLRGAWAYAGDLLVRR
jgi:hypothetical protein